MYTLSTNKPFCASFARKELRCGGRRNMRQTDAAIHIRSFQTGKGMYTGTPCSRVFIQKHFFFLCRNKKVDAGNMKGKIALAFLIVLLAILGSQTTTQSNIIKKYFVQKEITLPIDKTELWRLISTPGKMKDTHPFIKELTIIQWDSEKRGDYVEYLNGRIMRRNILNWDEGEGYDLTISEQNHSHYVVWKIKKVSDKQSSLSISIYPSFSSPYNLPGLSFLAHHLYIRPKLEAYLDSVLRGYAFYIEHGKPVPRCHFGTNSWFSPNSCT